MSWTTYHSRGEILRTVTAVADQRRDGMLPMEVDGVRERFTDDLDLLGALLLTWHTRLVGNIERCLAVDPHGTEAETSVEDRVVAAWQRTADDLPGVLAIIDQHRAAPTSEAMARALGISQTKQYVLLAGMAGHPISDQRAALAAGVRLEARAREAYRPETPLLTRPLRGILDRLGRLRGRMAA